jgi:ABC-2 type transport system permease protein
MRLAQLTAVAVKEVRQTARDKRTLALLLVAPALQLVLLGYAVNLDTKHIQLFVADADGTAVSRAFVDGLTAGDTFVLAGSSALAEDALRAVENAEVAVGLVIPSGFSRAVARGEPTVVQALTDGADSNRAIVAQNAIASHASLFGKEPALAQAERSRAREPAPLGHTAPEEGSPATPKAPPSAPLGLASGTSAPGQVQVEPRLLYNPTLNSRHYFVPGVGATLLMIITSIVTAMGLAREKEQGTLEAVIVTPIPPLVLVLGKMLPYAIIGLLDLTLVLVSGAGLFGVPMRGPLLLVFTGGLLYMLTTLGLGLYIASVARTQQQAFVMAFSLMLPMVLLSGFVSPIANMPQWLGAITVFDPMRHFVEILRGVLLRSATFSDMAPELVALAGLGLAVFLLSVQALGRKLS